MKNPGLNAFSYLEHAPTHPIWDDPHADVDPDRRPSPEEDEDSDWVRPRRWPVPGDVARLAPAEVGEFKPGEEPEDVAHGEIVTPEEHEAAQAVFRGDHLSDQPSANPDVEAPRQELMKTHTRNVIDTVSQLLRGRRPDAVGDVDEASDYLRGGFTGVKVNPDRGTLVAHSPHDTMTVRRHQLAITDGRQQPTYSLTSERHKKTVEADEPEHIVKTLIALNMVNAQHAAIESRKKEQDDEQSSLSTTSAVNDLCPVCASGYLEPYSHEHHECLNCGSLVGHVGFSKSARKNYDDEPTGDELDDLFAEHDGLPEHPDADLPAGETKTYRFNHGSGEFESPRPHWEDEIWPRHGAARPKGGLGRGIRGISDRAELGGEANPVNISQSDEDVASAISDVAEGQGIHPLADLVPVNPDQVYDAPTELREKGQVRRKSAGAPDDIDKHMGKLGWQPIHKEGQPRVFVTPLVGGEQGHHARLMEGTHGLWSLGTADMHRNPEGWTKATGQPHLPSSFAIPKDPADPDSEKQRMKLPLQGEKRMPQERMLAGGFHPIDDPRLAWAIKDLGEKGIQSRVYHDSLKHGKDYEEETPRLVNVPKADPEKPTPYSYREQQNRRHLSSVENPGLALFSRSTE